MTQGVRSISENGKSGLRNKTQTLFKKLRMRGEPIWWIKNVGSAYQRKGIPDFVVCYAGKFGALELKGTDAPPPTLSQRYELNAIREACGFTMLARTMDDVEHVFLNELRWRAGWWPGGIAVPRRLDSMNVEMKELMEIESRRPVVRV